MDNINRVKDLMYFLVAAEQLSVKILIKPFPGQNELIIYITHMEILFILVCKEGTTP